ncbi:hypothetical protein LSAT2_001155 [Lamellibrachia satsuma]|nr:hypothetical protein LSAT2_001155 [Lamellibrachia satsuma]
MWLLYVAAVLLVGDSASENAQQFFQYEQNVFPCNHSLQLNELIQIRWLINEVVCADLVVKTGGNTAITLDCGLQNRADMNITHLAVSSLETRDEGEFSCVVKKDIFSDFTKMTRFNVTINVKAENHTLLLDGMQHSCDSPVSVDTAGTSTLKCSVDSKPEATFTWSSQPGLTNSLVGSTACNPCSDKVCHCTNTLTLQNSVIPTSGVTVTCHVEAFGNTTNLCVKLGHLPPGLLPLGLLPLQSFAP